MVWNHVGFQLYGNDSGACTLSYGKGEKGRWMDEASRPLGKRVITGGGYCRDIIG